ncbi:MAG: tRNA guanosine(34) transglycosylase Tgt [Candidatus Pacebacteria bacterium]|nr:tRNA guanosine(34) transglycosylase Tgt [Candidatus Paceibacterota bacterium]
MSAISFDILAQRKGTKARAGVLHTPHGDILTPAFVAVGTQATVKGVSVPMLHESQVQTIISNTYHLHLQPGSAVVREMGGLHTFMGWNGPLLTDSGGFQVFSLGAAFGKHVSKVSREDLDASTHVASVYDPDVASSHGKLAQIDEEGVSFTSHIDGSLHRFTPERSVEIQHELGADIFFAFDECTGAEADYAYQKEAMDRTHRWAERSLRAHRQNIEAGTRQAIFGIVQGGRFEDLRRESARTLASMDFDGYGIGGSYQKFDLDTAVGWVTDELPPEKPRHLLGIGEPEDLVKGVEQGIDLFDCVTPTRYGRTGTVYGSHGERMALTNAQYVHDNQPIDPACTCSTCRSHTRAYLAHLFRAHEMLGATLASVHNLHFLTTLVRREREKMLGV